MEWKDIKICNIHTLKWIGKYAQCSKCHVITNDKEEDCVGYTDPKIIEKERKERRVKEREIRIKATIEYLKNKK
jgi:hypothetical protein